VARENRVYFQHIRIGNRPTDRTSVFVPFVFIAAPDQRLSDHRIRQPPAQCELRQRFGALAEPSLYGFFYTVPAIGVSRRAFVLAGSPEMASHDDGRRAIVAAGDVSPFALRRKTIRVLDNLSKLLNETELGWSDASAVKL
jgi:hypothetical protein